MAALSPSDAASADTLPARADLAAWLAVVAGTIGALMATLDISIVNSSLPTIQGEIGASGTEGTWIATSYLVAEIVVIPLTAWLQRLFGLRTLLLWAVSLFSAFSMLCGLSDDLGTMVVGRVGQGLTGGILIPTAMTIIATRLPPMQQPVGIAFFGATAILGPVVGPLMGGWLTENLSWHYAFFINLPIGVFLIGLLLLGLENEKLRLEELFNADWLGILGLIFGLGGLTIVLEEGNREEWFASTYIVLMTAMAVMGFLLLFAGQIVARKPVIKLSLLLNRAFGSVFVMSLALGAVLYGVAFVIPQFLAAIAGYNALQAGQIVAISGVPSMIMMMMVPILLRHIDVRVAVTAGLLILGTSSLLDAALTTQSGGEEFILSQLLRGTGQILVMLFLNQSAIRSVPPSDAADASGLFSAGRNLGGSIGLALLGMLQDQRLHFHERSLESAISANSLMGQDFIAANGGGTAAAIKLQQIIAQQALVITYNDVFHVVGIGVLCVLPFVFLLRPIKFKQAVAMH